MAKTGSAAVAVLFWAMVWGGLFSGNPGVDRLVKRGVVWRVVLAGDVHGLALSEPRIHAIPNRRACVAHLGTLIWKWLGPVTTEGRGHGTFALAHAGSSGMRCRARDRVAD